MNALQMIQQACLTLGFESPNTIQIVTDINIQRLVGHLNRAFETVIREYDWQALMRIADVEIRNNLLSFDIYTQVEDFDYLVSEYLYDMTNKKRINSFRPDDASWETFFDNAIDRKFVLRDNFVWFYPAFTDTTKISFWYKSRFAVVNLDEGYKEYFTKDLDTSLIDSRLLIRGLIWRYKAEIGSDYAEAFRDYEMYLNKLKDHDSNRRKIFENGYYGIACNIPDTGVGNYNAGD